MHANRYRRTVSWLGRALAASVLAAFTVSCGSSTSPQDHSEQGTYELQTVNGQSLPVTIATSSSGDVVVEDGFLVLIAASTNTYTAAIIGTANGSAPGPFLSDGGTYQRSGTILTFHSTTEPISYSGTYDPTTGNISVSVPGAALGVSGTIVLGLMRGAATD